MLAAFGGGLTLRSITQKKIVSFCKDMSQEVVLEGTTYCYKSKQNANPAPELEHVIQKFQVNIATGGILTECIRKNKSDEAGLVACFKANTDTIIAAATEKPLCALDAIDVAKKIAKDVDAKSVLEHMLNHKLTPPCKPNDEKCKQDLVAKHMIAKDVANCSILPNLHMHKKADGHMDVTQYDPTKILK